MLLHPMNITYDPDADAMYIRFREDAVSRTQEADRNTILDFNKDEEVIGVEILFVKERNPEMLKGFSFERGE
ncbi:DUF2283 domain-containing protein [Candidatus Woesearchaeota archaeon]|nr:DUF2283 domain-containing protein [Candidatus Woesearchaeota archaeon]